MTYSKDGEYAYINSTVKVRENQILYHVMLTHDTLHFGRHVLLLFLMQRCTQQVTLYDLHLAMHCMEPKQGVGIHQTLVVTNVLADKPAHTDINVEACMYSISAKQTKAEGEQRLQEEESPSWQGRAWFGGAGTCDFSRDCDSSGIGVIFVSTS